MAANGYFPEDRGNIWRKVDDWPTGYSNDTIFGVIKGGVKYIRTRKGVLNSEEVGIYANGNDMTARINTVFAHAWVKRIDFNCEQGGDILVTGTVSIPNNKTYSVQAGTRFNTSGSGAVNGGLVKADDNTQVWTGTKKATPYAPAGKYWSAGWWGLVADGTQNTNGSFQMVYSGTDNWDSLQKCINTVIASNGVGSGEIQIPSGNYRITKPLIVYNGTNFVTISIIGQRDAAWFPAAQSVGIFADFRDTFALGIHRGKGCYINGILFSGKFNAPHYFDGNTPAFYSTKFANFTDGLCRENTYSPYAGIVIDPFTNTGIYPGKSGNTDAPDINNAYPGLTSYYTDVKGDQYSGSSGINIENCFIQNFVVDYIVSPNGQTLNGEACNLSKVQFGPAKVAYAACQSQSRNNYITKCIAWGGVHTIVDNVTYAKYPQKGCAPYIEGFNIASLNIRIFNIVNDTWYGFFVKDMVTESCMTLGVLNTSMPVHIMDSEFKFIYGSEFGGASVRAYDYHLRSAQGITFTKCSIRYYGTNYPVVLDSNGTTFDECAFSNVPYCTGLLNAEIETPPIFINCSAGGYSLGADKRGNIGGNPLTAKSFIPHGKCSLREIEREVLSPGIQYYFNFDSTRIFGSRTVGTYTVTANVDATATFVYSNLDTAPIYVGDYIVEGNANRTAYETAETLNYPYFGFVTAINPVSKVVTLSNVPLYITTGSYSLAALRPVPFNIPFVANVDGFSVATNVECFTKSVDATQVYVRAFPAVGDTYLLPDGTYNVVKASDSVAKTVTFDTPTLYGVVDCQFVNYNPSILAKMRTSQYQSSKVFLKQMGLMFSGMLLSYEGYDDSITYTSTIQYFQVIKPGYHEDWVTTYPSQLSRRAKLSRNGDGLVSTAVTNYQVEGWEGTIRVDCTNNSVALIVGNIGSLIKKTINIERIDNTANSFSVTVNNDGESRTVNGAASYTVGSKKASILLTQSNVVLVQEISGSSGSVGGATKDAFVLTSDGSRALGAGTDLITIRIKPTSALTSFKIGTAAGQDDLATVDEAPAGVWSPITINTYFESAATIYFSGVTSSTSITIVKL